MKARTIPKKRPDTMPSYSETFQGSIFPNRHEMNITDGGEFMDDFWRMEEQPFGWNATKGKQ
ncbi:hypothetical protein GCM10027051_24920 [Niabella terrae]